MKRTEGDLNFNNDDNSVTNNTNYNSNNDNKKTKIPFQRNTPKQALHTTKSNQRDGDYNDNGDEEDDDDIIDDDDIDDDVDEVCALMLLET